MTHKYDSFAITEDSLQTGKIFKIDYENSLLNGQRVEFTGFEYNEPMAIDPYSREVLHFYALFEKHEEALRYIEQQRLESLAELTRTIDKQSSKKMKDDRLPF